MDPQRLRRAALAWLACAYSLTGLCSFAAAQVPGPPGPAGQDSGDSSVEPTPGIPEFPEAVIRGRREFPSVPADVGTSLSANPVETPLRQTGASVQVITADEIQRSGKQTVTEVLREAVGLQAVRLGPPGGVTSVFLRGANSQHTKVLLDGIPINDPSNATRGFDFSTLSLDNIERIEIVRGAQSVLFGSDAIGGAINIITRRGEGPLTARFTGMGGTLGTGQVRLQASGGTDQAYYSLGGSYLDTAGVSAALSDAEKDGLNQGAFSSRFGWNLTDSLNLDYVFRYSHTNAQVDDFDFFSGVPIQNLQRRNLTTSLFHRIQLQASTLDGLVQHRVALSLADYTRQDTDSGPFVAPRFEGATRTVDYQVDWLVAEGHVVTAGALFGHEEAVSTSDPQVDQQNGAAFLQDQFEVMDFWFATAGVRWDEYSTAGSAFTYRVTNVIHVDSWGLSFHGGLGTGFRAPALAENLFQFGNPDLRPEHSKSWDVGVGWQAENQALAWDVTYFSATFDNLILFDFNSFALANVGSSRSDGVELTVNYRWRDTSFGLLYTLTATHNDATGQMLLRRPRDKVTWLVDHTFVDLNASLQFDVTYYSHRLDTGNAILDDYFLANLTGRIALSPCADAFLRVNNLFDQDYEEVRGYGVPGIAAFVGLDWVF